MTVSVMFWKMRWNDSLKSLSSYKYLNLFIISCNNRIKSEKKRWNDPPANQFANTDAPGGFRFARAAEGAVRVAAAQRRSNSLE